VLLLYRKGGGARINLSDKLIEIREKTKKTYYEYREKIKKKGKEIATN